MQKAFIWLLSIVLFVAILTTDALAIRSNTPPASPGTVRLSRQIREFGSGENALVAVRSRDRSVVKGYIAQTGAQTFIVIDTDTGQQNIVRYTDVERLQAYNLVTGAEVHQGVGLRAKLGRAAMRLVRPMPAYNLTKRNTLIVGIIVGILLAIILGKVL